VEIRIPGTISLRPRGRDPFLKFLADMRGRWNNKVRYVQILVPNDVSFTVEGLALLCSELHELVINRNSEILVHATDSNARALGDILRGITHTKLSQDKDLHLEASDGSSRIFVASGRQVLGETFAERLDPYVASVGRQAAKRMYEAVVEAMANSIEHGYVENRFARSIHLSAARKWWFTGIISDQQAALAIADLGVGIPRTFKAEWLVASPELQTLIKDAAKTLDLPANADPLAILGAWKRSSTSTFMPGRGRGFLQICNVAKVAPNASVSVFSNRGLLLTRFEEPDYYTLYEFESSIFGTVTAWYLPFAPEAP
jgi:hypothetical protein